MRATLQKIEKGDPRCALGLYFEAASQVGVKLFHPEQAPLAMQIDHAKDKIAPLPQRIRIMPDVEFDDDF